MNGLVFQQKADSCLLRVRVHPGAKKNAVTGVHDEALKVSLTAPPVDGKANEMLIRFLADLFNIPRSAIAIISGETDRNKTIRISEIFAEQIRGKIASITSA